MEAIGKRGFSDEEPEIRCRTHSAGDPEAQLLSDGLGPELRQILEKLEIGNAEDLSDDELPARQRKHKTDCAASFAVRFREDPSSARDALPAFRTAIEQLPRLTRWTIHSIHLFRS